MTSKQLHVGPLRGQRSLTDELAGRIASQIMSGELASNERLPTVQEMALRFGVSRTVVRETMALLKADGLIIVRHGAGMFVSGDARRRPLRIDPDGVANVHDVVEIMQVRLGLEVEAAGIAAARRSATDLRRIKSALDAMINAARSNTLAVEEDRLFHREIALATGNQYFVQFLEFLGRYIIPRSSIRIGEDTVAERTDYLDRLEEEHSRIYRAIDEENPEAARLAMRRHLKRGLERLEHLKPAERADAERVIKQRRLDRF